MPTSQPSMTGGISLPYTAWEQATLVAIFAVVIVAIIVYVFAWQAKQQRSMQEFQATESKTWREYIREQNAQWQRWMEQSNSTTGEAMREVTAALKELRCVVEAHDDKVDTRVASIIDQQRRTARKP